VPDRNTPGPEGPDRPDDDIASLFGAVGDAGEDSESNEPPANDLAANSAASSVVGDEPVRRSRRRADDIDVDDDPDAYEPAFPPLPSAPTRPAPRLPDPWAEPPSFEIPELSMPVPPRPEPASRPRSTRLPGDGEKTFFWGLTPNDEPDPLVHGSDDDGPADKTGGEERGGSGPADKTGGEERGGSGSAGDRPSRGLVPPMVPLAADVPPAFADAHAEPSDAEPPANRESDDNWRPRRPDEASGDDAAREGSASGEPADPDATAAWTPPSFTAPASPEPAPSPFTIPEAPPTFAEPPTPSEPPTPPVLPPDSPAADEQRTVAMPAWIPPNEVPSSGDASDSPSPKPDEDAPSPDPTPDSSVPGTVMLPWLRRSRASRSAEHEAAEAAKARETPEVPDAEVPDASAPAASETEAQAKPASWSLFGDLFDQSARDAHDVPSTDAPAPASTEFESTVALGGHEADTAAPDPAEGRGTEPGASRPDARDSDHPESDDAESDNAESDDADSDEPIGSATDLFAALEATSATSTIPGASAGEAAAYDVPAGNGAGLSWPWGASAVAQPPTPPEDASGAAPDGVESAGDRSTDPRSADASSSDAKGTHVGRSDPASATVPLASSANGDAASETVADTAVAASEAPSRRGTPAGRARRSAGSASAMVAAAPRAARGSAATGAGGGTRGPISDQDDDGGGPSPRAQRIMLVVAGAMLLVLLLIALFIVGRTAMHPTAASAPTATPSRSATPTPTPTPTATAAATGPQAPGKHPWNSLRGGECLQPFTTAWAEMFTVVDCATPHAGQMVYTGVFSADPKAAFPGADQLASQINVLCSRPGVLNLGAAGQYDDAQVQGSYPVTDKQWKSGQRSYYCFVSRASGQPITGSLAGPGPQ
jgi:hypothetical protein